MHLERNFAPDARKHLRSFSSAEAAEFLGLPFNTYRYQLARGIERLSECMWRRELAESGRRHAEG